MRRRSFLMASLAFATLGIAGQATEPAVDGPTANLEQTLKNELRARRPVEFEFIHMVAVKVQTKELPAELVQSTFLWARKHRPYPYQYFERGLRVRAQRIGIDL